ncbi:hypothetical protein V6Z12_D07G189400 [Gossypium hirsutum]
MVSQAAGGSSSQGIKLNRRFWHYLPEVRADCMKKAAH